MLAIGKFDPLRTSYHGTSSKALDPHSAQTDKRRTMSDTSKLENTEKKTSRTTPILSGLPASDSITCWLVIGHVSNRNWRAKLIRSSTLVTSPHVRGSTCWRGELFLIFSLWCASSKMGQHQLGRTTPSAYSSGWFCVLFSAGYGIALLFFFGCGRTVCTYGRAPWRPMKR